MCIRDRGNTRQDFAFFVEAHGSDLLHPFFEAVHVVDALCLNEVGAGVDFLFETDDAELEGVCKGVCGGADEHSWLFYFSFLRVFDLVSGCKDFFIPHVFDHLNQLYRIEVEDVFCGRVVSETLVVAGEAEDITNAEKIGAQDIGLDAESVSVSAGHLDYWFEARIKDDFSGSDT